MTVFETEYFRVWMDEQEQQEGRSPAGLYRRVSDSTGNIVAEEAYNPSLGGWVLNNYWRRLLFRGGDEKYLMPVSEDLANQTRAEIDSFVEQRATDR